MYTNKIESYIREAHEKGVFNGTWLYAENGEIVSTGAIGWCDSADEIPVHESSLFGLACIGKQFTATAIMLLRRSGQLQLEDKITKFFPEIPYRDITIRHLLNHSSGLPGYDSWLSETLEKEHAVPGRDFILRFLQESGEEASFAPGEEFEYSNTGYCLLAQIVEKVSGLPFETFLEKHIFEPSGMSATQILRFPQDSSAAEYIAQGMSLNLGKLEPVNEAENFCDAILDGGCGGGLIYSNIFDLFRWDKALREEVLLTKEEQAMMYAPGKLNSGDPADEDCFEFGAGYGFGWYLDNIPALGRIVCHNGIWAGYFNWIERAVDADRLLVLLCSREAIDDRAYEAFSAGIKALARGEEPIPIRTIEELMCKDTDPRSWESLCGHYEFDKNSFFRIDEVFLRDSALYAKVVQGGNPYEVRLYPLGINRFTFKAFSDEISFENCGLTLWDETHRKL